jgi:hypothetical protein
MVGAAVEDYELQPPTNDARPISLLERLYRLKLVSTGVPWLTGPTIR